jgi:hypothetical protein
MKEHEMPTNDQSRRDFLKLAGAGLATTFLTPSMAAGLKLASSVTSTRADFYISPDGSDDWTGTSSVVDGKSTDGPFATLSRARDAVRELKRSSPGKDVVVLVRQGRYQLDETVVFSLEDSGQGDATVTYAAYPGESPVFSSGREISGWNNAPADLPGLPEEAQGHVWVADVAGKFHTLYDDEGLLPRARSAGFIPLKSGIHKSINILDKIQVIIVSSLTNLCP